MISVKILGVYRYVINWWLFSIHCHYLYGTIFYYVNKKNHRAYNKPAQIR